MLTVLVGVVTACDPITDTTSRLVPEPDLLERLRYQKGEIDTLFNHQMERLIVMAKLRDKEEPVPIQNGNFPENVELTFNILKDSLGQIIIVSIFPFSESGDWDIRLTHYFDKKGRTFVFERQTGFFNSMCTDGIAFETKTEFYNSDFELVDKKYELVDEEYKQLEKDSCVFNYDFDYKVSPTINDLLETSKIKDR